MKRPDLLLLIAIWEFISAFLALVGLAVIAAFAFPEAIDPFVGPAVPAVIFGLSIAALVLICYTGIAIAGGIGLLKGKEWGRVLSIVHAVPYLFGFPVGTTIGVLSIIYLTQAEVTEYIKACN